MKTTSTRKRKAALAVGVITAAAVLLPGAAFAGSQLTLAQNGGAARHQGDQTEAIRAAINGSSAKNVILLIGDGMGDSEITIARNYAKGADGRLLGLDNLPLTGSYTTFSLYNSGPDKGKPDYVTDSAASGSAWATGTKTYDGAISVDIDGKPQQTLIEIAKANGLRTGNVTTSEVQDATPAVQVAHVGARSCYGPDSPSCGSDALIAGGLGSISEQLLDTRADLTLAGGSASFKQTAKAGPYVGKTLLQQAKERGYQVVDSVAGLAGVTTADQKKPVLGLFSPGNMPTSFAPSVATVGGADLPAVTCQANPAKLSPKLALPTLTRKAISLLDAKKDGKGFFLQVEGASIDKQDHAANACGQIGETIDFDNAVRSALDFAKKDGNTLVIATADHAHTSQIVDSTPPSTLSTALLTADGSVMKVAYGTAAAGGSQQHTGTQVRIAAYGPGAANVVGLSDQTDTFFTMSRALELDRDTASFSSKATATVLDSQPDRGEILTVKGTKFGGDRQVSLKLGSRVLGTVDVIDGTVQTTFRAPTVRGAASLTLTGVQSGKAAVAGFTVR